MEKIKIIIDTNLWVSLLIGKRLSEMYSLCNAEYIEVNICDELMEEFKRVTSLERIKKYVSDERVAQTMKLMKASSVLSPIKRSVVSSKLRDANDLYLLAFADSIKADYLLTGDKDLLSLQSHNQTKIVTYTDFKAMIDKLN